MPSPTGFIATPDYVPYGQSNKFSIWVTSSGIEYNMSAKMVNAHIIKRKNRVWTAEMLFMGLTANEKDNIVKGGNIFKFFSENALILVGIIDEAESDSLVLSIARGRGRIANKLVNAVYNGRKEYLNQPNTSIINDLLTNTGVTPIVNDLYGNISLRVEFSKIMQTLSTIAEQLGWELWESWGSYPYEELHINMAANKGGSSVKMNFVRTGTEANIVISSKKPDYASQINHVTLLGYGDGINQLRSENYHANTNRTNLNGILDATSTTITVDSTTGFATAGKIKIGQEIVAYTGTTSTTFTGCTRGSTDEDGASTTAYAHDDGIEVLLYYDNTTYFTPKNYNNAQAASSIGTYGLKSQTLIRREILNQNALDLLAQNIISRFKDPVDRMTLIPSDIFDTLNNVDVGDLISVTDTVSRLSGNYRIVGLDIIVDKGIGKLTIELSNIQFSMAEEIMQTSHAASKEGTFMQGSTNIYQIPMFDSVSNPSNPLNLRFYLPAETISLNKVKVNFKIKPYRHGVASGVVSTTAANTIWSGNGNTTITSNSVFTDSGAGSFTINRHTQFVTFCGAVEIVSGNATTAYIPIGIRVLDTGTNVGYPDNSGASTNFTMTFPKADTIPNGAIRMPFAFTLGGDFFGKTFKFQYTCEQNATVVIKTSEIVVAATDIIVVDTSQTTPPITLSAGVDGSTLTPIGTYTSDQSNLDITSQLKALSDFGVDKWYTVRFEPAGLVRLDTNLFVQCFIDSK